MSEGNPPTGGSYLLSETVISLAEAASRAETHVSVVYRWIHDGLRGGIKLEACLRGSRWVTSAEALNRYFDRLTAARRGHAIDSGVPAPRTASQRISESKAAAEECKALGC